MTEAALVIALTLPALLVALPAILDLWMFIRAHGHLSAPGETGAATQKLIFVVPAHDEELLIQRTVSSLSEQNYPPSLFSIVVVADNCTDRTAELATKSGAMVLVRESVSDRGKGHALAWVWDRLKKEQFDALVIVDADTIVEPDFASRIAARGILNDRAFQTYDGMSNESETPLTRMAGVLTRNRYGIGCRLKEAAGISCPMTGDGTVVGKGLLMRFGLQTKTITEAWELYAMYTLAGLRCEYIWDAKMYAQEARSTAQSGSQRARWTSGRLTVLRLYLTEILRARSLTLLQRLDLLAELSGLGPVMRGFVSIVGITLSLFLADPGRVTLVVAFSCGILQPILYSLISLRDHPDPRGALAAFASLPGYAVWRVGLGFKAFALLGRSSWVRTARHVEDEAHRPDR